MPDDAQPAFEILPGRRSLSVGGVEQGVGARAFDVLALLHRRAGQVVTKAELLEKVWADLTVEESNLTVQIAALRKILGPRAIATVPGVGYQLNLVPEAPSPAPQSLPLPEKPSLAVLPFANLTGDAGKDYLIDGIVSDLIAALSRIRAFFVIAASSTFALKGQSLDLTDLGQRLGVRYILEGSIQLAGDRLKINTQLVEAESGHTLWSSRFTGALADLFELQDEVVAATASAIEPSVIIAESLRASTKPTENLTAYDLCLRASPLATRLPNAAGFEAASKLLSSALDLDPGYVDAKALTCRLFSNALCIRAITFEEARACLPLAEEILADDRITDALALADAGWALGFFGGQPERAVSVLRRAYALNPSSFYVLIASGWVHYYVGSFDIAEAHLSRAIRLNPIDANIATARCGLAGILQARGEVDTAVEMLEQAMADEPNAASTLLHLAPAYLKVGRIEEAQRICDRLMKMAPWMTISGYLRDTPDRVPDSRKDFEAAFRALGMPE